MIKKENQRVVLTKRLLREALVSLMEEKEIDRISVSELCALAGINRSTFYKHYGSQYDVLEEMGYLLVDKIVELGLPEDDLEKQVTAVCAYMQQNRRDFQLLLRNFGVESPVIQAMFRGRIAAVPQYGNSLAACDEVERGLLDVFVMNGVYALIRHWLLDEVNKTPEDMGRIAGRIARDGWM